MIDPKPLEFPPVQMIKTLIGGVKKQARAPTCPKNGDGQGSIE